MAAAEVVLAQAKHHVPLEVLVDDQPGVYHLHELARDDEHGEVLVVLDLLVEAQRLPGPLLVALPRRSSP